MPELLSLADWTSSTSGPIFGGANRGAKVVAARIGRLNLASNLGYSANSDP